MNKNDKLNLAISKCFGQSHLTEDDISCIKEISALDLILKHGLNENQVRLVYLWCQYECQRRWGQDFQYPYDETKEYCEESPFKQHKHVGFRS